jgi:transposase
MTKLHDKISGTFRNPAAARDFATTRSYVQTTIKHGHSPLDALRQLFTTGAWLPAPT